MSLMLDALKRIEAKQTSIAARNADVPPGTTGWQPVATTVELLAPPAPIAATEPIELPPPLPAHDLPNLSLDDLALLEPLSLEAAMDQLEAFVSEADSLYDSAPEIDAAELPDAVQPAAELLDAEQPAAAALPVASAVVEEPATPVDEVMAAEAASPLMQAVEDDGPGVEFTEETSLPEAEPPVVAPVANDPYAATAHQILRQLPRGRSQVLLFTSPADGHGKTMTIARLAPLLAQGMEGNVLVVDANFRNPDIARWLAVAAAWRLPDVLAGVADWATAVQATAHDRVSLLPGGTDAYGHSPGRTVQALGHLLRELAGHYELVVVDASSLAHRGAVQLAAVCDGTYLVVRLGEGSPRMLREAGQVIERNGGRLLGCVAIA